MTLLVRGCAMILLWLWQPVSAPPAAIVESLTGVATILEPQKKGVQRVEPYGWLTAGSTLSVGRQSVIVLLFSNGSRWQLGENSTATLTADGPAKSKGDVRLLGTVSPLPRVAPIAGLPPSRVAAVRLRTQIQRIRDLYPFSGASTVADQTSLRFSAVQGISTYQVVIQNDEGNPVFKEETKTTEVIVPAGTLNPGKRYRWEVRGSDLLGLRALGEATFETLSAENLDRRRALHKLGDSDGISAAVLARIDIALGLFKEGLEELSSAVAKQPEDRALRSELQDLQRRMKEEQD